MEDNQQGPRGRVLDKRTPIKGLEGTTKIWNNHHEPRGQQYDVEQPSTG